MTCFSLLVGALPVPQLHWAMKSTQVKFFRLPNLKCRRLGKKNLQGWDRQMKSWDPHYRRTSPTMLKNSNETGIRRRNVSAKNRGNPRGTAQRMLPASPTMSFSYFSASVVLNFLKCHYSPSHKHMIRKPRLWIQCWGLWDIFNPLVSSEDLGGSWISGANDLGGTSGSVAAAAAAGDGGFGFVVFLIQGIL